MTMQGQGESQPGESVDALDDLANALSGNEQDEGEEAAPEESNSEEQDESEGGEDEEQAEGEDDAEEPIFTITHDGKEVSLKQSELIEQAQKGFDYTKKAMAVAEERKTVEAERARASEFRAEHEHKANEIAKHLTALVQFLETEVGDPPPIEWAQQDAAYFLAQKELYEQRKGKLERARQALEHTESERQRERQANLSQRAQETLAALQNTLPGWNENTLPDLEKYVQGFGIKPESAEGGYLLKGLWQLAHKAKAYDAIQATKAQMKPKVSLAKVDKPAAANTSAKVAERVKREAAFNKNPSVDALAALLR